MSDSVEHASQPTKPAWLYTQSGVVPLRRETMDGEWRICLITSRKGTRWVIPKGVVDPGQTHIESAEREAWEEAGLRGRILEPPLGRYRYEKWKGTCTVTVYAMLVDEAPDDWPEAETRTREWLTLDEALPRIDEPELRTLVRAATECVDSAE